MTTLICSHCEAEGSADDAYCNECGWDGVIFADRDPPNHGSDKYRPGDIVTLNPVDAVIAEWRALSPIHRLLTNRRLNGFF